MRTVVKNFSDLGQLGEELSLGLGLAESGGNEAENPDRGDFHDDKNHRHEDIVGLLNDIDQHLGLFLHRRQDRGKQDREHDKGEQVHFRGAGKTGSR